MRGHNRRSLRHLRWLLVLSAVLAGCGGNGAASQSGGSATSSGKPAYCASLQKLETSVKAIPSPSEIKQNGTNALNSALSRVKADATTVVNDAKSQFGAQTSALKHSVDALSTSLGQLSSPPTAAQLEALPAQLSAVGSAAKELQSSASPKCD